MRAIASAWSGGTEMISRTSLPLIYNLIFSLRANLGLSASTRPQLHTTKVSRGLAARSGEDADGDGSKSFKLTKDLAAESLPLTQRRA